MKKVYSDLSIRPIEIRIESEVLAGSVTAVPVKTGSTVPVKDYESGFADDNPHNLDF